MDMSQSCFLALRHSVFNVRLFDLDQDTDCDGSMPLARRRSTMSAAGQKATVWRCPRYFRFTPENRHSS